MTLRLAMGFDNYPTGAMTSAQGGAYGWYDDAPVVATPGRFGYGKYITGPGGGTNDWMTKVITQDGDTFNEIYMGIGLRTTGTAAIGFLASALGVQCYVSFDSDLGVVKAYRGDITGAQTLLGYSAAGRVPQNVWMYAEVHIKIGDSDGIIEVRINTETVLSLPVCDNQNQVSDFIDAIRLWQGGTDLARWDDFYVCDTAGSTNNNYLGNVRVQGLLPSAPGNQTEWTSYDGVMPNWQAAGNTAISDTQYVFNPFDEPGEYDLYDLPALVNSPNIYGVVVYGAYRQDDATQIFVQNAIRTNGADYYGALHACFQEYFVFSDVYETNPDTAAGWTFTEVNSLQIGPKQQD